MHKLDLENVNWEHPSHQNIVDLYYARMWAISETVAMSIREDIPLSPLFIDDIRTNFLSLTNLNRDRFDSIIREGSHILEQWGIPEVFVVATERGFGYTSEEEEEYVDARIFTEEDMEAEDEMNADGTISENNAVLLVMQAIYPRYNRRSQSIEKAFLKVVAPKGGDYANEI